MIDGRKSTLNHAWNKDQQTAVELTVGFFRELAPYAAERFSRPAALLIDFCTLRHNRTGAVEIHPMHTDARFFGRKGEGLTFWCPLDEVGTTAPGVTLLLDGREVTPKLGPGQALVIPPEVQHRTQAIDGERVSIEFRCVPADGIPENVGESPIATLRRRGDYVGILIEAAGRPVAFLAMGERTAEPLNR